jgi:hypothetical protein
MERSSFVSASGFSVSVLAGRCPGGDDLSGGEGAWRGSELVAARSLAGRPSDDLYSLNLETKLGTWGGSHISGPAMLFLWPKLGIATGGIGGPVKRGM